MRVCEIDRGSRQFFSCASQRSLSDAHDTTEPGFVVPVSDCLNHNLITNWSLMLPFLTRSHSWQNRSTRPSSGALCICQNELFASTASNRLTDPSVPSLESTSVLTISPHCQFSFCVFPLVFRSPLRIYVHSDTDGV